MPQEQRSERSRGQILDAALAPLLAAGVPRHQHARDRARSEALDRQRLPPVPRQGEPVPDAARALLRAARFARPPVQPGRFFLHDFAVELVFGVPNHFGKDAETVLGEAVDILAKGMIRAEAAPRKRR
jgi:hypothetical protein